jgi:uncharacterized protein YhfF
MLNYTKKKHSMLLMDVTSSIVNVGHRDAQGVLSVLMINAHTYKFGGLEGEGDQTITQYKKINYGRD